MVATATHLPPIPTANLTDILRTCAMFFGHGQVTELRALEVSNGRLRRPHIERGYLPYTNIRVTKGKLG
jgi:hypothetical protein